MECRCQGPGFCQLLNREQTQHHYDVCQGRVKDLEKAEVIRQNWLRLAGKPVDPDECPYRGEKLGVETCHICGNRGRKVQLYECSIYGSCSITAHHVGQKEHVCDTCISKPKPLQEKWNKKITGLLPVHDNQNFNCSLLNYNGRRMFAYRHGWGGARLVLSELDEHWNPIWQKQLYFPYHHLNVFQEDPRLFVFKGQLHVAFTAVQVSPKTVARVGYASLVDRGKNNWYVDRYYLPHYDKCNAWEKNWGFFEAEGKLWCVYDAARHTILEVDKSVATLAYATNTTTIPGNFGHIRGGAAPMLHQDKFYSFVHFRREPKNYAGGLYTFEPTPPFKVIGHVTYPFLTPNKAHCSHPYASEVVYPAGAALFDNRWVISYGAYDIDSRIAAYDPQDVDNAIKLRIKR